MKHILIVFLILTIGLKVQAWENLKNGDLIFETAGESDFSKAIEESTSLNKYHNEKETNLGKDQAVLEFVHVGIIEVTDNGTFVIEASPDEGVRQIPLAQFIGFNPEEDSDSSGSIKEITEENKEIKTISSKNPKAFVVKRLNMEFPVEKTIDRAKSFLGQLYDWYYLPDNEKMYCSELVYESYLNKKGDHIFDTTPMNFLAPDGSLPEFWKQLFQKIGMEVPQGIPGTNPNRMSSDPRLITIRIF